MRFVRAAVAWLTDLWRSWDTFWFSPLHPAGLGVTRILAGGMILYTHIVWGLKLHAFFGPDGWQDPLLVRTFQREGAGLTFWWLAPTEWITTVHYVCLAILACFMIGLWTRVTSVLSFLIVISYANRAPLATFGLDQINGLLAMYLAVAPCGDCYSVDRWIRRFRQALSATRDGRSSWLALPAPKVSAGFATRLIQVHMCIMYLFAGLSKLKGESWWDGNAIWLGAANYEYQSGDLTWLAWHPWIGQFCAHLTVIWEATFWVFVWRPKLRPLVLLAGVGMHLGIGAFLGMWTFGLVMIFTYVSFIRPATVQSCLRLLNPFRNLAPATVRYGASRGSRWRAALVCATRPGQACTLERQATPAPLLQPQPASPAQSSPAQSSPGDWWRALRERGSLEWPFPTADEQNEVGPRHVLAMSVRISEQIKLQEMFGSMGHFCRAAADVPALCGALSARPSQCLVLIVHQAEELDDVQCLRELCIAGGSRAPATVVVLSKALADDVNWSPLRDHRLMLPPFTFSELRNEVWTAWSQHRGGLTPPEGTHGAHPTMMTSSRA